VPAIEGRRSDPAAARQQDPRSRAVPHPADIRRHPRRSARWRGALLILLVISLAYLPCLRGGFILDDHILPTERKE